MSVCPLLAPRSRLERAVRRKLKWLLGLRQLPQCAPPAPQLKPTLQLTYLTSHNGTGSRAATTREKIWPWNAEASQSQDAAWVGEGQQSLLACTQAVHQKQPSTLMMAALPGATPRYTLRVHVGPACPALRPHNSYFGQPGNGQISRNIRDIKTDSRRNRQFEQTDH